jgi:DNA-binding transcriptional regulator YhcF (GntR family)
MKYEYGTKRNELVPMQKINCKGLVAACVFYACRRKNSTLTPKEIAKIFELEYTDVTMGCKKFTRLMKCKHMTFEMKSSTPSDFVLRYGRQLNISKIYIDQATKLVKNMEKINIGSNHTPSSLAIGCLYFVTELNNLNITVKQMATKFDISQVTIDKAYTTITSHKYIILSDTIVDKIYEISKKQQLEIQMKGKFKTMYCNIKLRELKQGKITHDQYLDFLVANSTVVEDDTLEEYQRLFSNLANKNIN